MQVELEDGLHRYEWSGDSGREVVRADIVERLKRIDDGARQGALVRMVHDLGVEIPTHPPAAYAPMTWDDARRCARRGVTFGPHTVTHPILARTDDRRSAAEITTSWRRVSAEVPESVPVFCYPNGDPGSFGPREQRVLDQLGMVAALTTVQGFASRPRLAAAGANRFAVPRFPYLEERAPFRQVVSGLERAKRLVLGRPGA